METPVIEADQGRKISVTFERKVGLDSYGNVTARAWVEDNIATDSDTSATCNTVVELFNAVKAAVYDTLGIEAFMDEQGVLREKHEPVVSVQQAENKVGTQIGTSGSVKVMNPEKLPDGVTPAWVVEKAAANGITAVWANFTRNGDFYVREAVPKGGVGKGPDGKGMALYEN